MVNFQPLLELQKIDTALLQLSHRHATLEERAELTKSTSALVATQGLRATAGDQLAAARRAISNLEATNKSHDAQINKYSQQLRTVIAPREAEALQHEIETVRAERNANDDQELTLLESCEGLEAQLGQLADEETARLADVASAKMKLDEALKGCAEQKKLLDDQRFAVVATIDAKLIKLYDTKRNKRTTPAVADLHGSKCQSCHLDLSVVELAALKKLAGDAPAECPNCDCYLAV